MMETPIVHTKPVCRRWNVRLNQLTEGEIESQLPSRLNKENSSQPVTCRQKDNLRCAVVILGECLLLSQSPHTHTHTRDWVWKKKVEGKTKLYHDG